MNGAEKDPGSSHRDLLSKMSRYEALFELAGVINAATDIESGAQVLARRLKYVADVIAWRYICFDGDPQGPESSEPAAIMIDGHRGRVEVTRTVPTRLSPFEMDSWRDRKPRVLCGEPMSEALAQLPSHFRRGDLEQISVNPVVEDGRTQALYLFCKRRQPFTELDVKCLSMLCGFFHRKVRTLWEQQKLRDLELAYLQQEVMLRQSERLATLGRLSAGMAHELNNPAAAARHGAEQLRATVAHLGRAQLSLGAEDLSGEERDRLEKFEQEVDRRLAGSVSLDPIASGDLEQEVEDWLEERGVQDPWEHASTLVALGLGVDELEQITETFDPRRIPIVIHYIGHRITAHSLLEDIGQGARRVSEIVGALKGYSYMDQAPVQAVDVREGLSDTMVILNSKLSEAITVDLDYAADLPNIQGYGSELNQVWTHLIDNAIGAMSSGGTLQLKAYAEEGAVVVEVADSGEGIPEEAQQRIFDPFYTTKPPGEGTGLGLSISHGIVVDKHRGQISVRSRPGATRFTVRLPIDDSSSATTGGDSIATALQAGLEEGER